MFKGDRYFIFFSQYGRQASDASIYITPSNMDMGSKQR